MILKTILSALISICLGPFGMTTKFFDMMKAPKFYFRWIVDIFPYFECLRYIIPLEELIPLFIAILAVLLIRIIIALMRLFFGKVIPIW